MNYEAVITTTTLIAVFMKKMFDCQIYPNSKLSTIYNVMTEIENFSMV